MTSRLKQALRPNPSAKEVDLSYGGITDLQPLLPSLAAMTAMTGLNLRGNRLEELPRNMSDLTTVERLDACENKFNTVEDVAEGLRSLPALKHLRISFTAQRQDDALVEALPSLRTLNGTSVMHMGSPPQRAARETVKPEPQSSRPRPMLGGGGAPITAGGSEEAEEEDDIREVALTQSDLEAVALLFGATKALDGRMSDEESRVLTDMFDSHIQGVMKSLGGRLEDLDDPFLRQSEILKAKVELFDICFTQAARHASTKSKDFGNVLTKMQSVHNNLFSEFHRVLNDMQPYYVRKLTHKASEVEKAKGETAQLLEAAEMLEKEVDAHAAEKEDIGKAFESERRRLLAENQQLSREVQDLKGRLRLAGISEPRSSSQPAPAAKATRGKGYAAALRKKTTQAPAMQKKPASPEKNGGAAAKAINIRELTLKQLKEIIESIYTSKEKFDAKCLNAHLPRETMEQHMYTYLNQKYGLRSLIIEHASSIVRAVNKYSDEDNDVCVFGKILRNEIDEEFRFVQKQLKETVVELLRLYLKGKNPLKTDDAINDMLIERLKGEVLYEEWVDIIKYMYNQSDSVQLIVLVKDDIASRGEPQGSPSRFRRSRSGHSDAQSLMIPFKHFMKILLSFQLKGHEKFLSKFRRIFRQFDTDKNGVLNEAEFRDLVAVVDPDKREEDIEETVMTIDPYQNGQVTFSECVSALSMDLVRMMGGAESLPPPAPVE